MTTEQAQGATTSYLERNIRTLLDEYPALGDVLSGYGIGCVTCAVGTCALKDIVQYHYLPDEQMRELMHRMAMIIDPDGVVELPAGPAPSAQAAPRAISYSPPMKALVQEHTLIKRWLALIPDVLARIDLESEADRQTILEGIDYIRTYADRFHHAKEEDILFKHFEDGQEIIRVMLEDHTTGRNHVQGMLAAVEARDAAQLAAHLLGYRALLTEHIRKEDEILYPWMDHQLSTAQVGELFREFADADSRVAPGLAERFTSFIERLEQSVKG